MQERERERSSMRHNKRGVVIFGRFLIAKPPVSAHIPTGRETESR